MSTKRKRLFIGLAAALMIAVVTRGDAPLATTFVGLYEAREGGDVTLVAVSKTHPAEAVRAACELLERLVVKVPVGPGGEPEPVSDAEIAEARRIVEETLSELATELGRDAPEEPR